MAIHWIYIGHSFINIYHSHDCSLVSFFCLWHTQFVSAPNTCSISFLFHIPLHFIGLGRLFHYNRASHNIFLRFPSCSGFTTSLYSLRTGTNKTCVAQLMTLVTSFWNQHIRLGVSTHFPSLLPLANHPPLYQWKHTCIYTTYSRENRKLRRQDLMLPRWQLLRWFNDYGEAAGIEPRMKSWLHRYGGKMRPCKPSYR